MGNEKEVADASAGVFRVAARHRIGAVIGGAYEVMRPIFGHWPHFLVFCHRLGVDRAAAGLLHLLSQLFPRLRSE